MDNELFSCRDKVVLVLGGAGLIGSKIVEGLAAFGARVYVADKNMKKDRTIASDTEATIPFEPMPASVSPKCSA